MHPLFSIIFSFLLVCLETTTANQLAAAGGRGDDNGVIHKCLDKERLALLQFKSGLQDPYHYGCLSTWIAEVEDCCNWSGVTCHNQTGHVVELEINCGLVGKISPSLLNLTYLNILDLSGNSFHGTIPKFIGSMTQLQYLRLSVNSFHGTIPKFIGSMTQLKYLDLSSNSFHGTIPKFIGSMTRLKYLDLSVNSFSGTIPKFIGSMTQLKYLRLSVNSFHGTIPKFIGSMTQLKYLGLSSNSFSGTVPPEFGNLTNLRGLFLGFVGRCSVENIEWLSRLSHLEELDMVGISLAKQNHWVDVILSLQKLSLLSLWGCELSQVMHPYSSSFLNSSSSSIEILDLSNNNLNSSMYRWLFPLTSNKLRYLDLSSNMLDGIPKFLGNLCSLEWLEFNNNSAVVEFPVFLNNLSGCTSLALQVLFAYDSQFTGSLPDEIQKFPSLTDLELYNNQLNGTISEKLWELPNLHNLYVSSNYLRGAISENIGKSKLLFIDLSKNSLQGVPSSDHMSNLSYIDSIDLSSCKLGPHFPKWIQNLKNLTSLKFANTSISDTIPLEFWDMWPSRLGFLNLSSNNISGKVPDLLSNFNNYSVIDLSSNSFDGPIPNVSSTVSLLNLSKNNFSGGISFLCQIVGGFLEYLDLSQNSLSGPVPDCLWHVKELRVLNLGNNSLSGRIPTSVRSLINLEVLDLYKNEFSGELPLSLQNCTSLSVLNLGANKFSGNVPTWIGENLAGLYVLKLTSNKFFGTIPLQLCQLANLQILDLSMNNLHGTIPSCVNNLTAMVQEGPVEYQNQHDFVYNLTYFDHAMIGWQGVEREFLSNLRLLKMIDLSSNNLTGQIPYEVANLHELIALNLSKNALHGEIPQKIGEMNKLLVLDLSRNYFSGEIPSSMSQMPLLSYLDVSSNNLSGRIPSSTQLQSFDSSRYSGNVGLCGLPLPQKCPGDEEPEVPSFVGKSESDGEDTDEDWGWFYIGIGTGFTTGFWIVCGTLLLNRRGRHVFFNFYDSFKDWVYVKVVVFIASLKKDEHR